jgi:hypothetical protein
MRYVLMLALCAGAAMAETKGTPASVTGWVLDSACAYTKGLVKPISSECAIACAKKGSPLAILRDDGTIFLPVDEAMPAAGQNERLMQFAGKRVTATGRTYKRSGSLALVIDKIDLVK